MVGRSDPLFCADKFVDENTNTFDWSSCTRRLSAKAPRTSGKAVTTEPCDQNLYWCRLLDKSWSRTVLDVKGHWRVLTIYRISGLSWVHFFKRDEKSSDPKGWIRGPTKIGPVLEGTICCLHGKKELRSCPWTQTILNTGSEFLMAQTSWSRIWTTMSRKSQKISSKNMRKNWMQKILHADRRRKQNDKEENLLALHQESFLLKKGIGSILKQGNILSRNTRYRWK